MSHQHRLGNWNENNNPIRDARARSSAGNSSVGFNNRRERGSRTTPNQLVPELNIHIPPRHDSGSSSTTINHDGDHDHYPPTRVLPTTITTTTSTVNGDLGCTKRSRSTRGESSDDEDGGISSRRRTIPPHQDNVNSMSSRTQMNSPTTTHDPIEHDDPTWPFDIIIALGHQEDPSTNFPRGINDPSPTSAATGLGQNGDNSNNFEFFDTTSSSVPPPLTTSDPSRSNYRLNPPPGPEFTTDVQTDQTDSGLRRSENVALSGGNNRNLTSQELMAERNWLRDQMSSSLQRLSNGGTMQRLDWMLLDYSILLNDLIDSQERLERLEQIYDSEDNSVVDWIHELFEETPLGLTEQEILRCIQQEIYQSRTEETSTMSQTCTICQEDYVEGERIGRVDCMHIYHLDCIKQWLEQKNLCPICKQTALEIDESESEDE